MMPVLPESTWLLLSKATDHISKMCDCSIEDAREALTEAIRDRQVPARGTRPNPAYKKALAAGFPGGFGGPEYESAFPPQGGCHLKPELFRQHNIDWQTNTLGEFSDVAVNRTSLLQWLGRVEGVQNPEEAAPKDGDPPSHPTVDGPTIEVPEEPKLSNNQPPDWRNQIKNWYVDEYIPEQGTEARPPSRSDDVDAAHAAFPEWNFGRNVVWGLRQKHAPKEWKNPGAPKKAKK